MSEPVPYWVRVVTVVAVSVVAAVAAIASYVHMHELAKEAGEGWRAVIIPLSVDGMLVAASMVMLIRRRAGQPAGVLPWTGLILGIIASLAANVAAADPTPLSWIVSAWPPLALAVSFELLILVSRDTEQQKGTDADQGVRDVPERAEPAATAHVPHVGDVPEPVRAERVIPERPEQPKRRPAVPSRDDRRRVAELRTWLAELSRDDQPEPTPYAIRKRFGCNQDVAGRLLQQAKAEPVLQAV